MKSIYKFELKMKIGEQIIDMPKDAVVLSLGNQNEKLVIWASVNIGVPNEKRKFILFHTGTEFEYTPGRFVGTALFDNGGYVLHCFEEVK